MMAVLMEQPRPPYSTWLETNANAPKHSIKLRISHQRLHHRLMASRWPQIIVVEKRNEVTHCCSQTDIAGSRSSSGKAIENANSWILDARENETSVVGRCIVHDKNFIIPTEKLPQYRIDCLFDVNLAVTDGHYDACAWSYLAFASRGCADPIRPSLDNVEN